MRTLRFLVPGLLLLLAACGSSGSKAKSSGTTVPATTTTGMAAANGAAVNLAQTSLGMVLVDGQGRTLYYLTKESASNITCTAACATTWPPLLIPSGQQPTPGAGLTGSLTAVSRPDGTKQAAYDNHPLYTYSGDTKPGDTKGQGVGGVWFALTASGSSAAGGAGAAPAVTSPTTKAPTATTTASYGGGY